MKSCLLCGAYLLQGIIVAFLCISKWNINEIPVFCYVWFLKEQISWNSQVRDIDNLQPKSLVLKEFLFIDLKANTLDI